MDRSRLPILTANKITLLRIILLPIPYLLIYGDKTQQLISLALFTLLGFTDFLDGIIARRYGSTKLGALLDPIADKIFLSFTMIPLYEFGILPFWMIGLVLIREFFITELRRIVTINIDDAKVSILGKVKTIVQMSGMGFIFLLFVLQNKLPLYIIIISTLLIFGILSILSFIRSKRFNERDVLLVILFSLFLIILMNFDNNTIFYLYGLIITIITLVSGFYYIIKCYKHIFNKQILEKLRLILSILIPVLVIIITPYTPKYMMPFIILIFALEFSAQALDIWINTVIKKDLSWLKVSILIPVLITLFLMSYLLGNILLASKIFIIITLALLLLYTCLDIWIHRKILFQMR